MDKKRLFIALNLPNEIKTNVGQIAIELKKKNPTTDIKWVDPSLFHITLAFLGYLGQREEKELKAILEDLISDYKPFPLQLKEISGFPSFEKPRVVILQMKETGGNELQSFYANLNNELRKHHFDIDTKPFRAHVTIGRVREGAKVVINSNGISVPDSRFQIKSVDLMESILSKHGPTYNSLASYEF